MLYTVSVKAPSLPLLATSTLSRFTQVHRTTTRDLGTSGLFTISHRGTCVGNNAGSMAVSWKPGRAEQICFWLSSVNSDCAKESRKDNPACVCSRIIFGGNFWRDRRCTNLATVNFRENVLRKLRRTQLIAQPGLSQTPRKRHCVYATGCWPAS